MISQISSNAAILFGEDAVQLVGQNLSKVLGTENAAEVRRVLQSGSWKEASPVRMSIDRKGEQVPVNAILHRYDDLDFVELEIVTPEGAEVASRAYHLVQASILRIQKSVNPPDLWEAAVAEAQRITGYDRVMLYKFDRDEHGSIIAERKQEHQQSFLGLHYPASDIPEQARRLYRVNWVRYIPDIHYRPVPLIPVVNEDHSRLTDLTHSVLRSVSPIHCEYLHNMGVAASMRGSG